jgi:hypothetical protein
MIRPPRFAGRYYFADAGRLRASVESYIEDSNSSRLDGRIIGLIVPHAPHPECGPIAGFAYKMLLTTPLVWDSITLVAASNTASALACDPSGAYDLPTQPVRVDQSLLAELHGHGARIELETDDEPLIETHLPFVQAALGDVAVLPLRAPAGTVAPQLDGVAARLGLLIAIANLPAAFEQTACAAIEQLDITFFAGDAAPVKSKGLAGLFGSKPSRPPVSPDCATLALALSAARANGATVGKVLKRGGALAACVLLRS